MRNKAVIFLIGALMLTLTGCGGTSYDLEITSTDISRTPSLKANMQIVSFNEDSGDLMFQEIADEDQENLDTLVIASDEGVSKTQESSLSSYVQTSINQLKLIGGYSLSKEKSKKTSVGEGANSYPAILKTFNIVSDGTDLSVAQLFIDKKDTVLMLSYASTDESHTKKFVKELSSIKMNF